MTRPLSSSAAVKALALVVFIAAVAGATYGVSMLLGDNVEGQLLSVQPARAQLNATPGNAVTYALTLLNRGDAQRDVAAVVSGPGVEASVPAQAIPAGGSATVFVTLDVPATLAPGDHALNVTLADGAGNALRTRDGLLTLRVLDPASGTPFGASDAGQIVYTGRVGGVVFQTNDPALADRTFPQTSDFSQRAAPTTVRAGPRPAYTPDLHYATLGLIPGESRTVTLEADRGFGNETIEERIPREQSFERREEIRLPQSAITSQAFATFLSETGQGTPDQYAVNDTVVSESDGERVRYRIVNMTSDGVVLRLHVEMGERYSVYAFWPNASEVVEVRGETAVFLTTPTTGDEPFTFEESWPEMSRVARVDDDTIVVRHDPPVGLQYAQQGQIQPRSYTVAAVEDDVIVVTTPSDHPLAGARLVYDVLLLATTPTE